MTKNQLASAIQDDDSWKVDGAPIHTVKIIGTVESKEEHSTNDNYRVSDGTGVIECKKWVDKDSNNLQSKDLRCS